MEAHKYQLYALSNASFKTPNYLGADGLLHTRPAQDLPLMTWPDGSWCHPANTFLRSLFEKGLSRNNRGGTLAIAAANISHLLRFCWERRIDILEINDNLFRDFVGELLDQERAGQPGQKAREANGVLAIGRTCLQFLDSVGRSAGDTGFVGAEGRIRAKLTESISVRTVQLRNEKFKTVRSWHHDAFPQPSVKRSRSPISTANIEKMRHAVPSISPSTHLRARRHTTLKLLEVTGARRGEIAGITLSSVVRASHMPNPMLELPTLKKGGNTTRFIPTSRADIRFILQYAQIHRRSVVRRALRSNDHGMLLVSERTGEALQPNTITQEIRLLRTAAGISEKSCPHMFRHRFITKLFVALIEHHRISNGDEFRRLLMDGEELKRKVAEWTDHANLKSLDQYIDLAFDEVGSYKKVYNLVNVGLAVDSFLATLDSMKQKSGVRDYDVDQEAFLDVVEALKADIEAAKVVL